MGGEWRKGRRNLFIFSGRVVGNPEAVGGDRRKGGHVCVTDVLSLSVSVFLRHTIGLEGFRL